MNTILNGFRQVVTQTRQDAMLLLACIAPFVMGAVFKFGIPPLEALLKNVFSLPTVIEPYYCMLNLFLSVMAPSLFCFVAAMIVLSEVDDNISNYLAVTPLGKKGYLLSRMGIPAAAAFVVTTIVLAAFSLTPLSFPLFVFTALMGTAQGVMLSLLVVSFSSNKLEGMAVTKLVGVILMGIPAPFFLTGKLQYLLSVLPSFWIAKAVIGKNLLFAAISVLLTVFWITVFIRRFERKTGLS